MIRRAVVLAAGRGRRLAPLTDLTPKPLIDVAGVALIDRVISSLVRAGITEVCVVVGHLADEVERHLRSGCDVTFEVVHQPEPLGSGDAVRMARPWLGDQAFFLTWGDVITGWYDYTRVLDGHRQASAATLGVIRLDDVSSGAAVVLDGQAQVTKIVEKPTGVPPSNLNNAGLMVLTSEIWPHVAKLRPSPRGELEFTDALASMLDAGAEMHGVVLEGPWFDVGTTESLLAARRQFTRDC